MEVDQALFWKGFLELLSHVGSSGGLYDHLGGRERIETCELIAQCPALAELLEHIELREA